MPPLRNVREDSGQVLSLRPIGAGGVDLFTDASALDPSVLSRAENITLAKGTADRRKGALKLTKFQTAGASRTFGTDAKYATFTPPLIPAGGFAFYRHFVATRPAGGNTAYVMGSRPTGQTFHVILITLSDAGVITVTWRDSGGNDRTVATSAVTDGSTVHLFAIYDAVAGTFTVYVNGASSGTPLTGLDSTLKPVQTTGVVWTFAVHKQTAAAVTANTHFDGVDDGFTLFTLRGTRPASGTTTLAETLRRHSARTFPTPQADYVLAHYDNDEASGTVMYDHSKYKNHGTYAGGPSVTFDVALLSVPTNLITRYGHPNGEVNVVVSAGDAFYEVTRGALT